MSKPRAANVWHCGSFLSISLALILRLRAAPNRFQCSSNYLPHLSPFFELIDSEGRWKVRRISQKNAFFLLFFKRLALKSDVKSTKNRHFSSKFAHNAPCRCQWLTYRMRFLTTDKEDPQLQNRCFHQPNVLVQGLYRHPWFDGQVHQNVVAFFVWIALY